MIARAINPLLKAEDIVKRRKAGIRDETVNNKTYKLEMDYILTNVDHSLHVLNSVSPVLTGSLAFAELIAGKHGV